MGGMYTTCQQWQRTLTYNDGRDLITQDYALNKFPRLMKTNDLPVFLQVPLNLRNTLLNNVMSAICVYDAQLDFVQANKELDQDLPNVWMALCPGSMKVPTPDHFHQLVSLLLMEKMNLTDEQ